MAKIHVIDDEKSTRLLVAGVLRKMGHEVLESDNGAEGLLNALADDPDVVISDVEMPKLNGFELVAQLRQTEGYRHTPVILLTSRSSRADMRMGMSQGASDYLTKPFEPKELIEAVDAQLERLKALRQTVDQQARDLASGKRQSAAPAEEAAPPEHADFAPTDFGDNTRDVSALWVLQVEVRNAAELRTHLNEREWRGMLRQLYTPSGPHSALRSANFVEYSERELLLSFQDTPGQAESAALRLTLGLADLFESARRTSEWLTHRYPHLSLPPVRLQASVDVGDAQIVTENLPSGGSRDRVCGPVLDTTQALRQADPEPLWAVVATEEAALAASGLLKFGQVSPASLWHQTLNLCALLGPGPDAMRKDTPTGAWV